MEILKNPGPEWTAQRGEVRGAVRSGSVVMADLPDSSPARDETKGVHAPRRQTRTMAEGPNPERFKVGEKSAAMAAVTPILAPLTPDTEIPGVAFNGWRPPDAAGAVGPNHLLTCVNGTVQIRQRPNGNILRAVTLRAFFATLGLQDVFDPRVIYDFYADRWVIICCAQRRDPQSSVLMAVSNTNNPMGAWQFHQIDAVLNDIDWSDFLNIGFNRTWLAVTSNRFRIDPNEDSSGSTLLVFRKSNLYAGNPAHQTFNLSSMFFSLVPAVTYDDYPVLMVIGNTRLYHWSYPPEQAAPLHNLIFIYEQNGEDRVLSSSAPVRWAGEPWDIAPGDDNFGRQPNGGARIHCGDDRIQNAVFRPPFLYVTHHAFLPQGGSPVRCATRFAAIEFNNTPAKATLILNSDGGERYLTYPSLAVSAARDVVIGFTLMGEDTIPSSAIAYRRGGDAEGVFRSIRVGHAGVNNYTGAADAEGRLRWGDYSTTVIDPADPGSVWTLQTYSQQDNLVPGWATSWMRFQLSNLP